MKPRFRVAAQTVKMGEVVVLPVATRLDLPPSRVLQAALEAELTDVTIIGYLPNGEEYFASSNADGGDVLWQLERSKLALLNVVDATTGAA